MGLWEPTIDVNTGCNWMCLFVADGTQVVFGRHCSGDNDVSC